MLTIPLLLFSNVSFSQESSDLFWDYTSLLCSSNTVNTNGGVSRESAFESAQSLLDKSLHPLLDTVIGLSVYAPTIQFFTALAKDFSDGDPCEGQAFVVLYPGRRVACSLDSFMSLLSSDNNGSNSLDGINEVDVTYGHASHDVEWDHQYPIAGDKSTSSVRSDGKPTAVLYGSIGSQSFCIMHNAITNMLDSESDTHSLNAYSVRHAFPGMTPVANTTRLQGFGVYLDIKNMEYKNVDDDSNSNKDKDKDKDSNSDNEKDKEKGEFPEGKEVAGVVLSTLLKNDPSIDRRDLYVLRDELTELEKKENALSGNGETLQDISQMKLWKMKDLGVQSVHSILNSDVSNISYQSYRISPPIFYR